MKFLELDQEATPAAPVPQARSANTNVGCYPATPATIVGQSSRSSESSRPGTLTHDIRSGNSSRVEALTAQAADPDAPCPNCGSGQWWQMPGESWHCRVCEPDMPLTATTLTLSCHKEQVPAVGSNAGLERTLEVACEGLTITPEQLRQELEKGGDMPDLQSGALTLQALRLTARTLALMRYPYALPIER
jgi:hypothetical protein